MMEFLGSEQVNWKEEEECGTGDQVLWNQKQGCPKENLHM